MYKQTINESTNLLSEYPQLRNDILTLFKLVSLKIQKPTILNIDFTHEITNIQATIKLLNDL